jgi:hypothetical protein
MQYAIIVTPKPSGGVYVSIPALSHQIIEAHNREEALTLARQTIANFLTRSEIIYLDVGPMVSSRSDGNDVPWEWFGFGKDDPSWDALFDEIERRRDATREAG